MARIVTYTFLMLGVLTLMQLAGISAYSSQMLAQIGFSNLNDFSLSRLFVELGIIFAAAGVTSIIIGYFTKQSTESYIVAALAGYLTLWIGADIVGLYYTIANQCPAGSECAWAANVVLAFIVPLLGAFAISIIQWWRGNDI